MSSSFNPEDIRLGTATPKSNAGKDIGLEVYKPKQGEQFLKGPIPWIWLCRAASERGKALHVAVFLWRLAGLTKKQTIALNLSRMVEAGVSRDSARRGLAALEKAGLVTVTRAPGRKPVITIVLNERTLGRGSEGKNGKGALP